METFERGDRQMNETRAAAGAGHQDADIVRSLRQWAMEKALPLWASTGFDRLRGGFHERLNLDGTPDYAANRRLLPQARQIYVYSHASVLGWFPDGCKLALEGLEFLLRNFWSPDGRPGYVHMLAPDGSVADSLRDTYEHTFVLLALAWAARASGDGQIRALVDDALAFFDEHLTAPDGSLVEGIPPSMPRRQNPHMHGFEAMLALHETLRHPQAITRARHMQQMLETAFFDAETDTIGEYFTDAWIRLPGGAGETVEPGHQAEWSWLLRRYARLAGLPGGDVATRLFDSTLRWVDPVTGFLVDEVTRHGRVTRASRRLWPQTELVKAWLGEAEAKRPQAGENACSLLARVARQYLDRPVIGGWIDQFDAAGLPISGYIPATALYHVFGAVVEADRVLGPMAAPRRRQ
jgi:mannose-6-phosphate isomerase